MGKNKKHESTKENEQKGSGSGHQGGHPIRKKAIGAPIIANRIESR